MHTTLHKYFHWGAVGSLGLLIVWCVLWEMVIAPLKPGGSWLVLKAAPLLLPLYGVWKRDIYTLQWTSMMILLYFTEGIVRGWSDADRDSAWLGWGEAIIVCVYFACALLYLRPYKRAAKKLAKELLDKVKVTTVK
ncbi:MULTISPECIES: DUF2069 domain-containing protein [unclassified Duganella]|uniref:DUF2069 domain-containing protein n=1 Tax=unclassified Duganella TaxID=2636909 RepID=UPI000701FC04|nr:MULTISPECIES: DUF2069 domain-containing protein [unclassified Duganella]KQN65239.1 hypothetical protein ASF04_20245 [Duganella sp. Leaf61]MPQ57409.1 DUF2069 domain-containing protein [Duganella sp. FT27W]